MVLHEWFQTPPGQYLLDWERAQFDAALVDVFGYHALQIGLPDIDALAANRMPHRWLALTTPPTGPAPAAAPPPPDGGEPRRIALVTDSAALPFAEASLDLVVLPHTLELSPDPHATLREVQRVLVHEGKVAIAGLNPASLWGLRQYRAHLYRSIGGGRLYLPDAGQFIGHWRLRDWLRLLNFELDAVQYGCYRPAVRTEPWLQRTAWMDDVGDRLWPILGAAYFMVGIKRVHGMRLLEPAWRSQRQRAGASVPLVSRAPGTWAGHHLHKD